MGFTSNNEKIDKYLDELADEYKALLFKALIEKSGSLDDLNVSDLLRIDSEVKKPLLTNNQKLQRKQKALLLTGLVYMLLGISMYFIYTTAFRNRLDIVALTSSLVTIIGFCICVFSFLAPNYLIRKAYADKKKDTEKVEDVRLIEYEIVRKWRELEGISNDMTSGEPPSSSPRSVIQFFAENSYITDDEEKILRNFLRLRNEIVHSSANNVKNIDMQNALVEAEKIIQKLRNYV